MHASNRRGARAWGAASLLVAALVAGCSNPPPPTPSPAPTPTAAPTATPAPSPTPVAYADTLRIGFIPGRWEEWNETFVGQRQASFGLFQVLVTPRSVVHGALYRFDARYDIVPDLADGRCFVPGADGKVLRCRLIETTFHDGTALTADDVAFTYAIAQRWQPSLSLASTGSLGEVQVVDPRTVDFVLTDVDPTFLTSVLPSIPILPRHAVEAAFADFIAATKDLEAADLAKLADTIDEEIGGNPPVCSPRVGEVTALLEKIGITLYREDFADATGAPDSCRYLAIASQFIRQAGVALGKTGPDAVAAAWQLLSVDWHPVGAGPYRFISEDAKGIHLEAWPGYHEGLAATRYLDFVPTGPDGSELAAGTVDIFQVANLGPAYLATSEAKGVRIATPPQPGYMALTFNVRPGRRFAEPRLRLALQLCVDLERSITAAAEGLPTPLYGPVLPGSWADDPDLPKLARDVSAARALIEASGWQLGSDGIYAKSGVPLAADILVRAEADDRVKMADLIAAQARDCGMDLRTRVASWSDLVAGFFTFPHYIPGTSEPFDLWLGGNVGPADPGVMDNVNSAYVTDAEHPDVFAGYNNFEGYADPVVDRLITEAMSTYDQAERARLYREVQQELAAELPILYLWADEAYDAVRSAVTTPDGPLDLTVPNWAWQPERLVVVSNP